MSLFLEMDMLNQEQFFAYFFLRPGLYCHICCCISGHEPNGLGKYANYSNVIGVFIQITRIIAAFFEPQNEYIYHLWIDEFYRGIRVYVSLECCFIISLS